MKIKDLIPPQTAKEIYAQCVNQEMELEKSLQVEVPKEKKIRFSPARLVARFKKGKRVWLQ